MFKQSIPFHGESYFQHREYVKGFKLTRLYSALTRSNELCISKSQGIPFEVSKQHIQRTNLKANWSNNTAAECLTPGPVVVLPLTPANCWLSTCIIIATVRHIVFAYTCRVMVCMYSTEVDEGFVLRAASGSSHDAQTMNLHHQCCGIIWLWPAQVKPLPWAGNHIVRCPWSLYVPNVPESTGWQLSGTSHG